MDIVRIEDLQTEAVIGVYDFEHKAPQPLIIDLELETDFSRAFRSDDLNDALDYDAITQAVRAFCESSRYALLEKMAGDLIAMIQERFNVDKVGIKIRKPAALKGAMASVWCERTRAEISQLEKSNG
ncbi:dihydroneopterin aldolase [Endozoicomonas sp. OPT23]|uniref:dihydroneopterin aldolase n=1 Tax=Endozoicomonas sp. OPT23 TaxID=2072845 RepID=UPI00129B5E5C|nr:dihydroneopterin aldolase [Endozoicomonas sp. OPT23]